MKSEWESGVTDRQSLSIKNLLQLAWRIAHLDLPQSDTVHLHEGRRPGSDPWLLEFWSTTRGLSQSWEMRRASATETLSDELTRTGIAAWENLAMEILAGDFLARILATVVASRETQPTAINADSHKALPILTRSIEHLEFARSQLLKELVHQEWAGVTLGKMCPRFERWTDMLIGPWIVRTGVASFACDPRRAWDFGEDRLADESSGLQRRLMQTGFETAFRGRLVEGTIDEPLLIALYRLAEELELDSTNRESSVGVQVTSIQCPCSDVQSNQLERSLRLHAAKQRRTPS